MLVDFDSIFTLINLKKLTKCVKTIRCLLIQPNPESSLNEEAGKLLLEDYSSFERTARVMTKVHALKREHIIEQYGHPRGTELKEPSLSTSASPSALASATKEGSVIHVDEEEKRGFESATTISSQSNGGVLQPVVGTQQSQSVSSDDGALAAAKKKKKAMAMKKKAGLKRL